jgi:hypothetical protein
MIFRQPAGLEFASGVEGGGEVMAATATGVAIDDRIVRQKDVPWFTPTPQIDPGLFRHPYLPEGRFARHKAGSKARAGSKSAQGQKPGQEASQRRRKRLRHNLARGFYDYSRAEGP